MSTKLYVGNLPWSFKDEDLMQLFSQYGTVTEAFVMKDKFSGRSKGFGFVNYETEEDAKKAVDALNNYEAEGRPLKIDFARPPKEKF